MTGADRHAASSPTRSARLEQPGRLKQLGRRWRRRRRLADLALAAGGWALGAVLLARAAPEAFLAPLLALLAAAGLGVLWRRERRRGPAVAAVARHLDRLCPELEESAELLLRSPETLAPLARLQRRRVASALTALDPRGLLPWRPPVRAAGAAAVLLLAAWAVWAAERPRAASAEDPPPEPRSLAAAAAVPELAGVLVEVRPPAYTGRSARLLSALEVEAEEGATVRWRLDTAGPVDAAALLFDESERVELARAAPSAQAPGGGAGESSEGDRIGPDAAGSRSSRFVGELTVTASHLYRVLLLSEGEVAARGGLARLEMIPDRPPRVEITAPRPWTELDAETRRLAVRAELVDDYGIGAASLYVTLAAGEGELVEFRERRIDLRRRRIGGDAAEVATATLDLEALGVAPGTDLYLFVEAADRREPLAQRARSATHVVSLPGERARAVELGEGLPILRLPEFFRSQRQIILDTERLVRERPTLTEAAARRRSESIGFDQRALRMRYGGLLGEEFEEGLPVGDGEEDEDEAVAEAFADGGGGESIAELVEGLPAGFAHEHDAAAVATFFDDRIKGLLKAAMREMWGAEGRLRSIDPERALPFEYRALRLLKSAQQAERVYVQRIGYEPPPLDPEGDRLTGELDGIVSRQRASVRSEPDDPDGVRAALAALFAWGGERQVAAAELAAALERVRPALVRRQLAGSPGAQGDSDRDQRRPATGDGLEALERLGELIGALRRGEAPPPEALRRVEAELWRLLPPPEPSPAPERRPADPVWADYRARLGEGG